VVALVCTSSLLLASCSGGTNGAGDRADRGGTNRLRPFTVVLDWTPNTNHAGMYLAQANGWYEDAGLAVKFIEPGEAGALQVLAAGKADVAVSVQEDVTPAVAEGLPVRSVAAIIEHNTSSLLSLASDGITEPADLAGKTYGGFGGRLEHALVDKLAECGGGDPRSVKKVDVGEADYKIGLQRDQYDLVWVFDGWDGIRLRQEGVRTNTIRFMDHTDCIPDWYTPLLATSTKTEARRGDDLKAFMAATARGYREAMAHPDRSAEALLASSKDLDPKLVRASAEYLATRYAEDPDAWGRQDPTIWSRFSAFVLEAGLIDQPIQVDEAWTNEYLPAP
jgi:ABC-type nitrate/sulfonate/bicarbonate transport system substrate-binding protein